MAAVILMRRAPVNLKTPNHDVNDSHDRDDELQAQLTHSGTSELDSEFKDEPKIPQIDVPAHVSPDSLMGKMPKADKILKKDILKKFSTSHGWKPMQVVLTSVGLYLARPDEDLLRDLIPLHEIVEVKRRSDVPDLRKQEPEKALKDLSTSKNHGMQSSKREATNKNRTLGRQGSIVKLASLTEGELQAEETEKYIMQLRTVEGGYNSGRTYYISVGTDEDCQAWIQGIRTASDKAVLLRQAGPGFLEKARYRLRRAYHSVYIQSLVAFCIFLSFLSNIMQSELGNTSDPAYNTLFNILEYLFTILFTIELCVNVLVHPSLSFVKVGQSTHQESSLPPHVSSRHHNSFTRFPQQLPRSRMFCLPDQNREDMCSSRTSRRPHLMFLHLLTPLIPVVLILTLDSTLYSRALAETKTLSCSVHTDRLIAP